MTRDITMILAVMASLMSVVFGVYKHIEANRAKAFAYEQAYQILNQVQNAPIAPAVKASILDAGLGVIATPPPVIDFSKSSADDVPTGICSVQDEVVCLSLAESLGAANTEHRDTSAIKTEMLLYQCFACFSD